VKRLVALPSSRVELRDGDLVVNDRVVPEPYVQGAERGASGPWNTGEGYFFLGDNRRESHDSRAWGSLPSGHLEGRVWVR
jgi:signal peptidase I